jgi:hypothetical protein
MNKISRIAAILTTFFLISNCKMKTSNHVSNEIREIVKWNDLQIRLFEPVDFLTIEYESVSNITAYDNNGNVVWKAEPPKSPHDIYSSMSIDTANNLLIADSGYSFRHIINLENGKVIKFFLVK